MSGPAKARSGLIVGQLTLASVVLLGWEWASATKTIDPFFFSRTSDIVLRVGQWVGTGALWQDLLTTLTEAVLSFVIGVSLGVLFGFALATVPMLAALLDPYIRIANALPRVVLAPIFLLWFGLGIWSKVALGVTVVFFIVFFNTYRGIREVDRAIMRACRSLAPTGATYNPQCTDVDLRACTSVSGWPLLPWLVKSGASRGIGFSTDRGCFDTTEYSRAAVLATGCYSSRSGHALGTDCSDGNRSTQRRSRHCTNIRRSGTSQRSRPFAGT